MWPREMRPSLPKLQRKNLSLTARNLEKEPVRLKTRSQSPKSARRAQRSLILSLNLSQSDKDRLTTRKKPRSIAGLFVMLNTADQLSSFWVDLWALTISVCTSRGTCS